MEVESGDFVKFDSHLRTTAPGVFAAGAPRLPYRTFQVGDERCNRTAFGFTSGTLARRARRGRPKELAVRGAFLSRFGDVYSTPMRLLLPRLARVVMAHLELVPMAFG